MKKAIPYYDPILNRTIKPIRPNAFKMEFYLSDVFPNASHLKALVVSRDEYAPVRNPNGKPIASPEKAREHITRLHLRYLLQAGAIVKGADDKDPGKVEISPLVSVRGEGLEDFAGVTIQTPCYILDKSEVDEKEPLEQVTQSVALQRKENCYYYVHLYHSC